MPEINTKINARDGLKHPSLKHFELNHPRKDESAVRNLKHIQQRINQPLFSVMGRGVSSVDLIEYSIKAVAVAALMAIPAYAASSLLLTAYRVYTGLGILGRPILLLGLLSSGAVAASLYIRKNARPVHFVQRNQKNTFFSKLPHCIQNEMLMKAELQYVKEQKQRQEDLMLRRELAARQAAAHQERLALREQNKDWSWWKWDKK